MNKNHNEIFIDFEAISFPLTKLIWKIKNENDYPYCFSMMNKKTEEIFFYMTDFKSDPYKEIGNAIRQKIQEWKILEPKFIAWNGILETKIIKRINLDWKVVDQFINNKKFSPSLDKMTIQYPKQKDYFNYFNIARFPKKIINVLEKGIGKKRNFSQVSNYQKLNSGTIASIVGLYFFDHSQEKLIFKEFNYDNQKILDEIRDYSLDDVKRMLWLFKKPELANKTYCELKNFYDTKPKRMRKAFDLRRIIDSLEHYIIEDSKSLLEYLINHKNSLKSDNQKMLEELGDFVSEDLKKDLLKEQKKLEVKINDLQNSLKMVFNDMDFKLINRTLLKKLLQNEVKKENKLNNDFLNQLKDLS